MSSNPPVLVYNELRKPRAARTKRNTVVVQVKTAGQKTEQVEVVKLEFNVFGEMLCFRIAVGQQLAGLTDLVPLARMLSTKLVSVVKRNIAGHGDSMPCRPGCSRCCRYLVPVSIPEVLCLAQEITRAAPWKRLLMSESCLLTARCVLELTPKTLLSDKFINEETPRMPGLKDVSDWYADMNLPCPFLLGNLCMIYDKRPLACREYLVTGSAQGCRPDSVNEARVVRAPVSILEALVQLTSELTGNGIETIVLPFLCVWCQDNREYAEYKWPAAYLVRRFVSILTTLDMENKEMIPLPHEK